MTGDDLKSCNKGDIGENSNLYFPGQACKYNFCIIAFFILFFLCIKTEKLKPSMNLLIRLCLS